MVELRLDRIARMMAGKIIQGDPQAVFRGFGIDSRIIAPGDLFFALTGERNGHDFIPHALEKEAGGAVVSQNTPPLPGSFAVIRVEDTVEALQRLAREVLSARKMKVVGITGSIGKTTTKEITASLLANKFSVLKSEKNYNNHLGLALSLLKMNPSHEVAVLEMAMRSCGEIRTLTRVAPPDVAVLTNINPVHLEFFQSVEEIALAKKEILEGAKDGGTAVLNGDDPLVAKISQDWRGARITFGFSPDCDVHPTAIRKKGFEGMDVGLKLFAETMEVHFPFLNESYIYNLLAALGVAHVFGLRLSQVSESIRNLKPFLGRGVAISLKNGIRLIDDSYNSNPKAVESMLTELAALPAKRKVAVLGDMLELGLEEKRFHEQTGRQAAQSGWDLLVTVGLLSENTAKAAISSGMKKGRVFSFKDADEAAEVIPGFLEEGDLVLVKGSRAVKTEKIVERIKDKLGEA